MDHPNIARVLDGGETAGGRPYFVMELVKGIPITEYCDQNQLNPTQRLELFRHVCQAVQHAHQKGIIHRDLKPSNVLVTVLDTAPVVKVIDFGIAKALGQQLTDKTLFTSSAQLIGTPLYMSPEQASLTKADVDTRSDIYSLGVLLYELLTGTTPFDRERLKEVDYDEMRRVVREEEPLRPSTRISTLGPAAETVCTQRGTDPKRLSQLFRGDLDWIVMKALEKDRDRRYQTASALAADVHRYLADEPVEARAPSSWYRFRKFARRYRLPLILAGLALATMVVAVFGLAIGLIAVDRERKEATRQRDNAQTQRNLARRAVDKMYTQVAEKWLSEQPHLEPQQKEFLEEALHFYQEFGEAKSADPELRLGTGDAYRRVGEIQAKLGELDKAEQALTRSIALLQELIADYPRERQYRHVLACSHQNLGAQLLRRNRFEEAEKQFQKALLLREKLIAECPKVPEYDEGLAISMYGIAQVWLREGRGREAAETFCQALSILQALPPDLANQAECRIHQACCRRDLGLALAADGRPGEAEASCRYAVLLLEKVVKDLPKDTRARHNLARGLWSLCSLLPDHSSSEPETLLRRVLAISGELVHDYPAVADYRGLATLGQAALSEWLQEHGRFREADEAFSQALCDYEKFVGDFSSLPIYGLQLAESWLVLRHLLLESGRFHEAEKTFRKTLAQAESFAARFPRTHRFRHLVALSHHALGLVLGELSRAQEAEVAFRKALAIWSDLVKENPALEEEYRLWLAWSYNDLADLFATCPAPTYRDPCQAVELAQKAVVLHPGYFGFWNTLGTAHYRVGDYIAAVKELEKSMTMHDGGDCYDWFFLAMAHLQLDHKPEARKFYDRATAWMEKNERKLEKSKLQAARFRRFRAEAADLLGRLDPPGHAKGNEGTPTKH
jgi:tetratricopeptide (TPR) repeat protein